MAYCEDTDLFQAFGQKNIERWADLDNEGDQDDIDDRIQWAIDLGYDYINSKLIRGHYEIPFEDPPKTIIHLNALQAGIILYDSRLVVDSDKDQVSRQRKTANNWIRQILRGQLKLIDSNGDLIETQSLLHPFVDESEDDDELTELNYDAI